jgi:hypothetical protein
MLHHLSSVEARQQIGTVISTSEGIDVAARAYLPGIASRWGYEWAPDAEDIRVFQTVNSACPPALTRSISFPTSTPTDEGLPSHSVQRQYEDHAHRAVGMPLYIGSKSIRLVPLLEVIYVWFTTTRKSSRGLHAWELLLHMLQSASTEGVEGGLGKCTVVFRS